MERKTGQHIDPIYLRHLDRARDKRMAEEVRRQTPEERFHLGIALMARSLNQLWDLAQRRKSGASEAEVEKEFYQLILQFHQLDQRWVKLREQQREELFREPYH